MAQKKLKKKSTAKAKPRLDELASPVLDSAQDIWRAGLGALAMAQKESGKVAGQGAALFERLVAEGAIFEKQGKAVVDSSAAGVRTNLNAVRGEIEDRLEVARKQAEDRWDQLEGVFEQRVLRVIEGMGLATADDLRRLADRVEALSTSVGGRGAAQDVSPPGPAPAIMEASGKKAVGKKAAGKIAPARNPASKEETSMATKSKKAASKKATTKKAASKKATTKKAASKKAAPKKAAPKKAAPKKAAPKKAAPKKAAPKKAAPKKAAPKKAAPKKAAAKKAAPKKAAAKKAASKKAVSKKTARK